MHLRTPQTCIPPCSQMLRRKLRNKKWTRPLNEWNKKMFQKWKNLLKINRCLYYSTVFRRNRQSFTSFGTKIYVHALPWKKDKSYELYLQCRRERVTMAPFFWAKDGKSNKDRLCHNYEVSTNFPFFINFFLPPSTMHVSRVFFFLSHGPKDLYRLRPMTCHTHTQIDTYVCISIADFIQLIWPDFASENLLSNGQLGILSFLLPLLPSCCVGYLFLAHSHLIHHSALSELPMYIYLVANAFEQSLCTKSPFFLPPGNETNVTRIWTLILFSFFHLEKQLSRINTLGYR